MRVLMYSPDSIGLGHMRRNSAIAGEIVRQAPEASVAMLIGSGAGAFFSVPKGIDTIKLPSVQKIAAETWTARTLNLSVRETSEMRAGIICNVVRTLKPDLFLVDHLPTGVCGDLLPVLSMISQERLPTRLVLGLRDILDDPTIIRQRWSRNGTLQAIAAHYDRIVIYGEEEAYPSGKLYGLEQVLPSATSYVGYVCCAALTERTPPADPKSVTALPGLAEWSPGERIVIVAGGGGHDAYPMLSLTLAALAEMDGDPVRAVAIAGPLMPEGDRERLIQQVHGMARTRLLPWTADCMDYLSVADVAVVMAGYNSALEALSTSARVVMIPRPGPSAEQTIRTELLARQGLVTAIDTRTASAASVAAVLRDNLAKPPRTPNRDFLNGAARAAAEFISLIRRPSPRMSVPKYTEERSRYVVF